MREEDIERLRGVVRDCVNKHLYSSAIFFSDKVAALTGDPADIYMQAQALFLGRHFRRALHILTSSKIVFRDLRFRYLAAKCLEELREWHRCLKMLGDAKVDEHDNVNTSADCNETYMDKDGDDREINISSAIFFLRGKACEALENRAQALLWYKAAVKADPYCYEALECLIDNHMLTCEEEKILLSTLEFAPSDGWLSSFYYCLIKKYEKENVVEEKFAELEREFYDSGSLGATFARSLKNNTDLLTCKADYYHQCGEYEKCFDMTSMLLERDPFHMKCTLVHLAAAMELGRSNELYIMGCNMVKDYPQKKFQGNLDILCSFTKPWFMNDNFIISEVLQDFTHESLTKIVNIYFPKYLDALSQSWSEDMHPYGVSMFFTLKAISWFAIGCYYYCIKKFDQARRYFCKATSLDGTFAAAWICYGNAHAAKEEGDQTMAAFRTAARLFPGCHLPNLYFGMEYMRTHCFKLAEQAHKLCPSDPLVYNELGVVAYHMKEYQTAVRWFEKTLACVHSSLCDIWEPTFVNLAHSLRKLKRYPEAISYYEKAIALSNTSSSTYAGLAFTYHLQHDFDAAIAYYHKALALKVDDKFCTEMLSLALVDDARFRHNF